MSESCEASRNASEEANKPVGVPFIDLVEIIEVPEEQPQERDEEEQYINDREELRRRLCQAETSCRQKRELYDKTFGHGLALEELINELEAQNKNFTRKVKELQQQVSNIRKTKEEEEDEEDPSTYIRKLEKENRKLREKTADLTAELDQLSLGENYQDKLQNLRRAEQEFKHKQEEVQGALRSKDEEIQTKCMTLIQRNNKIEEYFNTIEDLRQDQRELREQLSSRQEEQILAPLNFQDESMTSETRQPLGSSATDEEDEEHKDERPLKTESWWGRAKGLWKGVKVAGAIAFCVLLPEGIMTCMEPVYNSPDPDYNLWNLVFDLLEPYSELHHTLPPVY
ncbi:tropomyosin-like [Siniperca chuatsi]|uniref:tropomyosin-like n=1 Tax=Siniperca chuatsi TaxID=119488 RepID=UPI001CE14A15|nr:tropomyosin-like [Siniperca chuatsi]